MTAILRNPATLVWLALLAITCASGWLAETHRGVHWANSLVVALSAMKIDLIMQHFMELRSAPLLWRSLLRLWLVAVSLIAVAGYWL